MRTQNLLKTLLLVASVTFFGCRKDDADDSKSNISSKLATNSNKHVLFVGIDGLQYEKIAGVNTPSLDNLNIRKAYAGGITGTPSQQATSSGPGWTTLLTGVWYDKHAVPNNSSGTYKSQAKSLFAYVKEAHPEAEIASVATWSPIHEFLDNDMSYVDRRYDGGNDAHAVTWAVNEIQNNDPDLLFVHLDYVDVEGHSSGWGSSYNNSIATADQQLGTLMQAVETRANQTGEDWLIIVATDHGRESTFGYSHGSQTTSEKTIFVGMNKTGNDEFNNYVSTVPNTDFGGLYGHIAQTSVTPTILRHLDININPDWQLSSAPLIGNDGPQKVMSAGGNSIYWHSTSSANANVYRNKQLIATVPANQGGYLDANAPTGQNTYTVELNGATGSVSRYNVPTDYVINAVLDWNDFTNDRSYLFRTDLQYIRYHKGNDAADSGYPKPITSSSWPGLDSYKDKISAAFKWHDHYGYFFLNDGTYIKYNMNTDQAVSGYPKAVNNSTWSGMASYGDKIVAAINWNNSKAYFFLNDGRYIRYSISNDQMDSGYPKQINNSTWPGMGAYATHITSAMDWNSQYCYFFLDDNTYIKYDKFTDAAVSGYPKPVNGSTWPGVL